MADLSVHHVWERGRSREGDERCWHCGAARLRVRRVLGTQGVLELFWTPGGWVRTRPACVAKRAAHRVGTGEPR